MTLKKPHGFLGSTNETFELARLPPLMLDWLGPDYITKEEISLRGYDVSCYPYSNKGIRIRGSVCSIITELL